MNKRKEEQRIFSDIEEVDKKGMFRIDTKSKVEALNFATLMNALEMTKQRLDPLFSKFGERVDVTIKLNDRKVWNEYTKYFGIRAERLNQEFAMAERAFSNLHETDEIIKRGSQDYPPLLAKTDQAPRFIYIRGKNHFFLKNGQWHW